MSLSASQRSRLDLEEVLVKQHFPGFRVDRGSSRPYITGLVSPTYGSRSYRLRLVFDQNFPYSEPDLYVTSPSPLWQHGGRRTIHSEGTSHRFHTLATEFRDRVRICHTEDWDASITAVKILIKGVAWLAAYEAHRHTGRDLASFLCG